MSLLLALAWAATADDAIATWQRLHDAMLLEADADLTGAVGHYEHLVRTLAGEDPVRTDALYRLGHARWDMGDTTGARDALREGVRTGVGRGRFLDLLDQIELRESGVTAVPTHWTFSAGEDHGIVHAWQYRDRGAVRVEDTPSGPALAWTTVVDPRRDDQLVFGFHDPAPVPRGVRFIAWSSALDAALRVVVTDASGHRYALPAEAVALPRAVPVQVDVPFAALVPVEPGSPPLAPSDCDRLTIQDVTAFYGTGTGPNVLFLDDVQVY